VGARLASEGGQWYGTSADKLPQTRKKGEISRRFEGTGKTVKARASINPRYIAPKCTLNIVEGKETPKKTCTYKSEIAGPPSNWLTSMMFEYARADVIFQSSLFHSYISFVSVASINDRSEHSSS